MQFSSSIEEYFSQFDVVSDSPIRYWQDSLSIGNGALGVLSYDSNGCYPEWTMNLHSLWQEQTPCFKRHSMEQIKELVREKKPFSKEMAKENPSATGKTTTPAYGAQLRMEAGISPLMAPSHRIKRKLSLYDGELHTFMDKHLSHMHLTSFVHPEENIFVTQVRKVSLTTAFRNTIRLFREKEPGVSAPQYGAKNDCIFFTQQLNSMSFTTVVKLVSRHQKNGGEYREFFKKITAPENYHYADPAEKISVSCDSESAWCSVFGDFDIFALILKDIPAESAIQILNQKINRMSETFQKDNQDFWHDFWKKNYIDLDNTGLEQLWYLSNYYLKLGGGVKPAWGLCGPWFSRTPEFHQHLPWNGFFTNDYNAQTMPLAVETINRGELAEGFFKMLADQLPQARKNAKLYDAEGAYYPLSGGPDGKDLTNGEFRFCQGSGAYWGLVMARHYRYSGNDKFLQNTAYPVLREISDFYASYMTYEPDGYHLYYSQNPELKYLHLSDPVDTLVFIKATLKASICAAEKLGKDADKCSKWKHILDHFPQYPTNEKGFSPLKGLRADHINHSRTLAMAFPSNEADPEFPDEIFATAKRELNNPVWDFFMKSYACKNGSSEGWTGKVYHRGLAACRLGKENIAWNYLQDMLKGTLKPNGLFSHNIAILCDSVFSEKNIEQIPEKEIFHDCGPLPMKLAEVASGRCWEECTEDLECKEKMFPVLEGNAVFLLLISEMLLQSHNQLIRVFPAWPHGRNAFFADLAAEGGACVTAELKDGETTYIKITSAKGGDFQLCNPWNGEYIFCNGQKMKPKKHIKFSIAAGETVYFSGKETFMEHRNRCPEKAAPHLIKTDDAILGMIGKFTPAEYYSRLHDLSQS